MRPWCGGCCRRRHNQELSQATLRRWTALLRLLRRLRRRQRFFAYLGHRLQDYPTGLRRRLRVCL
eukprot:5998723-Heterocapsa_arctica.AAC.1